MNIRSKFFQALFESSLSVLPIVFVVLILSWTGLSPITTTEGYFLLIVGGLILTIGMAIFSLGAEQGLSKVGQHIGANLSKQKNLFVVVIVAFMLGTLVTIAEPSISVLAAETPIPSWIFILVISVGSGLFIVIGVIRVFKHQSFRTWLLVLYGLIFAFWILLDSNGRSFIPLIFDSGGAATGSATVPFILALGAGVATVRGGDKSQEDSFGLVALASIGPVLLMIIMNLFPSNGFSNSYTNEVIDINSNLNIWELFKNQLFLTVDSTGQINSGIFIEVAIAIAPIMLIFFAYQKIFIKLPRNELLKILLGFIYTYIGLVLFLAAAQAAMMPFGKFVGGAIGNQHVGIIILIAFLIGVVTVLCEPSVHVLTKQVEEISDGGISRMSVLTSLSIGVGIAIAMCAIRAINNFDLVYYIVPGYLIALALSFVAPPLYTSLAFDSGSVVSGSMTVSFVLPFIIGITLTANGGNLDQVLSRAFGVVGMVSLIPVLVIQMLGVTVKYKEYKKALAFKRHIFDVDDNQIIYFDEEED